MFDDNMTARIDFRDTSLPSALSDEELSAACQKDLDAASVGDIANALRKTADEAALRLRDLRQSVERHAASIPLPTHIFVDPQERQAAYHAVCRLLVATEPLWRSLRESLIALSLREPELLFCREVQGRLAALLEETKRRENTDRAALRSMEQKFKRRVVRADAIEEGFSELRNNLRHLCADVEADFTARLSKIADFENEGAACEPSGCVRLCAELCRVIAAKEADVTKI